MIKLLSKAILIALATVVSLSLMTPAASAGKRYATPPPLVLSPNLSQPMMLQLRGSRHVVPRVSYDSTARRKYHRKKKVASRRHVSRSAMRRSGVVVRKKAPAKRTKTGFDPALMPTLVNYSSPHKAGTIIISTTERRLYLMMKDGKARRYGVGVGKLGFQWSGTNKISRKAEWPSWRPPSEMIAREAAKGRHIPAYMAGGPNNPLGARAMYLGATLYRIHGSNQPWSIGRAVSSGCIRMRNQDVIDLYERVGVGTKVVVL